MELTEPQWKVVELLFPPPKATGHPRQDDRLVLEGVLWVLRTGAPWKDLPRRFPPYQTCHRRFQQWVRSGLLDRILQALYEDLVERGQVKFDEWFIDGSFVPAKGGALLSLTVPEVRGARSWQSRTAMVNTNAVHLAPAAPHEVTLVHRTLDATFGLDHPARLIGDTAYDSDLLDEQLAAEGIEMIARNRKNRTKTQDGRPLRRARRRFVVERLFAWLQRFRRVVVRYERFAENYLGMVQLAAMVILLRRCGSDSIG
ncbi:IS5 family transposase [Deinococcus pimensis]|uniref:IS5 family transposase n=1 Tax=Deinococcus pimensis TaxID=309888 RepID=UPI0004AF8DE4|nr:IS5 family transposase [Deinococcus pimensis]